MDPQPRASSYSDIFSVLEATTSDVNNANPCPLIREVCAVCFDEHHPDVVVRLPDCDHVFCSPCLLSHVRAKMEEGIYPIVCPVCSIDWSRRVEDKTHIDQRVLDNLREDFPDEEYGKFENLQLTMFAMELQCPGCKQCIKAAREDLDNVLLTCPVPSCGSVWCRACQKVISSCEKSHSCRPDRRFRRMMRLKRWRFCPGCHTPIQRAEGCPHMTCRVPGCRTHFCYRCGGTIWMPGHRGDAYDAASFHNKWCRVVFVFNSCSIQ
ncbi:hypothetical protein FA15DRAFT_667755 [Coprinopsis marcescibilis]|uniref:RING-type domain-containing protein n=1 Tax=Coprinopsis marcescibilis TaxID=230819 RepID=A0A5C3L0D6_COPMA|nr:hypothetical protein FA15DRAFT_667755 [Coprinopsis marcescibilis]